MKRLAIAVVVLAAVSGVFLACPRTGRVFPGASRSPGAAPTSSPPDPGTAGTEGRPAGPATSDASPAPPRQAPEQGDAALRSRLGLKPAEGPSPVLAQMAEYSAEEHRLLAEVERKANGVPLGLRQIIERKRAGATHHELEQLADRLLTGNLRARAVVLEWLDAEFGVKGAEKPPAQRPIVKPLRK